MFVFECFLSHLCSGSSLPLLCGLYLPPLCGLSPPFVWLFSTVSVWIFSPHSLCGSFPSKSESSRQAFPKSLFSYPYCMSLLREKTIAASQWVWLVASMFCLSWVLVAGIALIPQPVSGSAPLFVESLPYFLFVIQFRQALILLAWLCRGLVQAELKRSLIAIVNKAKVLICQSE